MRHRYLVAYDVSDPRRLRLVHRKLLGFGDPLQYSVFQCDLSDVEKLRMVEAVSEIINHREDRVLIVDVGPTEGRAALAYEFLGVRDQLPAERAAVII
ncbi:CRISPR-associated endoribonuclease Cas2 [bacterium HR33]|nr:CRISPR-associated endoribonuclease Cas2 [bacterium HR33]